MEIRRICLLGGPGSGKSTIAAQIFAELKKLNLSVELVNEWIKILAYEKIKPKSFQQLYAFSKQINREDQFLRNDVKYIVTDSPILMNAIYAKKYKCPYWHQCVQIGLQFEDLFPALHIFLDRTGLNYETTGRYETINEAQDMDKYLWYNLSQYLVPLYSFQTVEYDKILEFILRQIKGE